MSVNTAHANNGVLIHSGESILLYSDNVIMEFPGRDDTIFRGTKNGRIYLTTHRMIFNNKNTSDPLLSFSFPFVSINDVQIEQPVFGANYIKGKVGAQENGNWQGEARFKLLFKNGGAIDFGQAMLRAAHMAMKNTDNRAPPPYSPPSSDWYQAPPPAYTPNPQGYYGWVPASQAFPTGPPPNSVFMTDNPPPYPGIVMGGGQPAGYQGGQPGYPGVPNGYPGGFASYPTPQGYPAQPQGYPQQQPQGYPGGYPNTQPGFQQPFTGYPGQNHGQQPGYPGGPQPGYPGQAQQPSYPNQPGYPGSAPPLANMSFQNQPNSKEAEATQSAYYDPSNPQTAYVPPPAYYEPPPSYNSLASKKGQ